MRALDDEEQEQRKRKVLQILIHEFIKTGKAVGSKSIVQIGQLALSSATVRNILSDLEKEGLITHPHTSAGSLPTDKGYRAYVDSLVELQRLALQEQARVQAEYEARIREIEDLLAQTSRLLSSLSHYTGFVMVPKLEKNIISRIELVPLTNNRILIALIAQSGLAKHFIIQTQLALSRERLRTIARILNQNLDGLSLQDVQVRILERIEDAEEKNREFMALARELGQEIKKIASSGEVYVDGASNILSLPDFSKTEELRDLFKMMEEKQTLAHLLEEELSSQQKGAEPKVRVRIGSENPVKALQNLSVVSSTYQFSDRTAGVLGILGPKRMEYSKMIALVDYVTQMVNRFLKKMENSPR